MGLSVEVQHTLAGPRDAAAGGADALERLLLAAEGARATLPVCSVELQKPHRAKTRLGG